MSRRQATTRGDVPLWTSEGAGRSKLDTLGFDGAMQLAVKIRDTWWRCGHVVRVWIEREKLCADNHAPFFVVRSDQLAGCARRSFTRGEEPIPVVLRNEAP